MAALDKYTNFEDTDISLAKRLLVLFRNKNRMSIAELNKVLGNSFIRYVNALSLLFCLGLITYNTKRKVLEINYEINTDLF